jgi:hypothetical protein
MQDATAGSQDPSVAGYSLQEAAALLGIGINTLRRRIAAGQIRGEQVQRPQGYVWRVYLEGRHTPMEPTSDPPNQEAPGSLPHPPAPAAQAEALAALVQATLTPVLTPLVAELAASRAMIERQADELGTVKRENGTLTERVAGLERELLNVPRRSDEERQRLTAELEAARAALDDLRTGRLAELERENGRLTECLALTAPTESPGAGQQTPATTGATSDSSRGLWWRSWLLSPGALIALAVLIAIVVQLLLVWTQ